MKPKVYAILSILFMVLWAAYAHSPVKEDRDPLSSKDDRRQMLWVDSVFNSLSFEERLGQLFMVAAYSNKDDKHRQQIAKLIQEQQLGGLIFFQGGPIRQANLTNYYQSISKTPLFIAMDAEWGVSMRLDSVIQFPKQMTLGAIQDDELIYEMGKEIAGQFKALGMHINFAPVVDVNSNPQNPVIGYRAFGEEKRLVARKSLAYMKGLQDHGVMANAKHFPGHGDTDSDSHYTTPVINNSFAKIEDIDLYPFRELIKEDLMSVMVAHLHVPSLGTSAKNPTTLTPNVVTNLLQEDMGFKGLIFTDALNMRGVSSHYKPGEVDLLALMAGNDILLYSEDVPKSKAMILQAIQEGKITEEEVDRRIRKVLKAKYWAGLHEKPYVDTRNLLAKLNAPSAALNIEDLYANSISVLTNKNNFLPLRNLDLLKMASISIGGDGVDFKGQLDRYGPFQHFTLNKDGESYASLNQKAKNFNTIVVGLMGMTNNSKRDFGLKESDVQFIKNLSRENNVIVVMFGNAYGAKFLDDLPHVLVAYEQNQWTEKLTPQIIFGGRAATGSLPVSVSDNFQIGTGGYLEKLDRLSYGRPENVGLDIQVLDQIDRVMEKAIVLKHTPGGTVLVAKNGKVVFERSYGYLDWQKSAKVNPETIYDLASITKVMATTQALMFLVSRRLVDMDRTIGHYLPELRNTNKGNLVIRDIMMHESGLVAWIPHYAKTVDGTGWKKEFFRENPEPGFQLEVAENMYAVNSLPDSLWAWTVKSDLKRLPPGRSRHDYTYSDLGMYLMQKLTERLLNQSIDEFLEQNYYAPLGIYTLTFKPLEKFPKDRIAPTEDDITFRKRLVRGYVHDPGSAMYGGVAGHAGLFGTANDLAIMMQMMLQGGNYGGINLIDRKTITEFTKRQSTQSRRAWGWDKPEPERGKGGSAGKLAPKSSFGHTGFTGTCVWADPENELVYVFLSNRVHPNANNNGLLKDGVRTEIHDIIYQALKN
ncbi:glycoside hydrolase family 3 N-terminal domain-containing protein [Pararhodonellum marinum]|uniref:glycoside hydrolase family 3 N-terminal domain-containing protein n=1 Tax=Pararhodonellum marinum TaxID=2755358 RepID=UPI00188F208B|nr:glycoside hydrolase family 3 N-terminal domain-containing protein [Pararhodonellum marinum]